MVRVLPMKAFRPPATLAAKLAAPPYDVINTEEARKMADGNEVSFLRVSEAPARLPVIGRKKLIKAAGEMTLPYCGHPWRQVNKPEIDLPPSISQYDLRVYETGAR